eukprot:scaffold267356_cov35-Tisochrysis_lutea.AAC.3
MCFTHSLPGFVGFAVDRSHLARSAPRLQVLRQFELHGQDGNLVARKRKKARRRKKNPGKRKKSNGEAESLSEPIATADEDGATGPSVVDENGLRGDGPPAGDPAGDSEPDSEPEAGEPEYETQEIALDFEHELYQLASDRQVCARTHLGREKCPRVLALHMEFPR